MNKYYWVYILASKSNVLYVGVTNNLQRRMLEHKSKIIDGFTKKYSVDKLVYFQEFLSPNDAIISEKRIKGWTRKKKIDLIKSVNPGFNDLFSQTS